MRWMLSTVSVLSFAIFSLCPVTVQHALFKSDMPQSANTSRLLAFFARKEYSAASCCHTPVTTLHARTLSSTCCLLPSSEFNELNCGYSTQVCMTTLVPVVSPHEHFFKSIHNALFTYQKILWPSHTLLAIQLRQDLSPPPKIIITCIGTRQKTSERKSNWSQVCRNITKQWRCFSMWPFLCSSHYREHWVTNWHNATRIRSIACTHRTNKGTDCRHHTGTYNNPEQSEREHFRQVTSV